MTGETRSEESGWTVDTLHALMNERDVRYEQRFQAQQKALQDALLAAEKAVSTAMASADRAVLKAENAAEKRFEGVNEFRATLADQAARLMPRQESEVSLAAMREKIDAALIRVNTMEANKHGATDNTKMLLAALGSALAVAGLFLALRTSPSPSPGLVTVAPPAAITTSPR